MPVTTLAAREGSVSSAHLYPIRTARRDALLSGLASRGIETAVHYPVPLHLQPAYAFLGHRRGDFPVSEAACETVLSLPLHPGLDRRGRATRSPARSAKCWRKDDAAPRLGGRARLLQRADAPAPRREAPQGGRGRGRLGHRGDLRRRRIRGRLVAAHRRCGPLVARGARRPPDAQLRLADGHRGGALREARGDAAAVLSADLQEPPELLPDLVAAWRRGAAAALAVRRSRPEGWASRAAAAVYYRALRRLAFSEMPAEGFDCFLVSRPAIDFLVSAKEVHTSLPGPAPLERLSRRARPLRPRRAGGRAARAGRSPRSSSTSPTRSSRSRTRRSG